MIKKNIFSILVAITILVLSLISADNFKKFPAAGLPGIDKVAHLGMYFLFSIVIFFENRKKTDKIIYLFLFSLVPFIFGLVMELLQLWITTSRSGNIFDMLFNLAGISLALITVLILRSIGNAVFK